MRFQQSFRIFVYVVVFVRRGQIFSKELNFSQFIQLHQTFRIQLTLHYILHCDNRQQQKKEEKLILFFQKTNKIILF